MCAVLCVLKLGGLVGWLVWGLRMWIKIALFCAQDIG